MDKNVGVILERPETHTVRVRSVDVFKPPTRESGDAGLSMVQMSVKNCRRTTVSSMRDQSALFSASFLVLSSMLNNCSQSINEHLKILTQKGWSHTGC